MKRQLRLLKIQEQDKERFSLTLMFAGWVFLIFVGIMVLTAAVLFVGAWLGWIDRDVTGLPITFLVSLMIMVVGFGAVLLVMRALLKPINQLVTQMNRLACGDYKARLDFDKYTKVNPAFTEMSDSFNTMAQELEGTEMLRSDFINNFSHEFKTPIVSIAGFAKLLRRGNLPKEQQEEYLGIIEKESLRLADMANNVLNLTKVENQAILTDVTTFNLSEQLRSSVLLLEDKWTRKDLVLELDIGEIMITANRELLKQVWVNLLDNGVKFAPAGATLSILAQELEDGVQVKIRNTGSTIAQSELDRIWRKFYQVDRSHSGAGNGVGLAVVKRITQLHGGEVYAESDDAGTTFTVELPKE